MIHRGLFLQIPSKTIHHRLLGVLVVVDSKATGGRWIAMIGINPTMFVYVLKRGF